MGKPDGHRYGSLFAIFFACFLFHLGCGKKGPPVVPQAVDPPAVKDLGAQMAGDRVRLSWSVPTRDRAILEGIEGFRLYKYEVRNPSARCPGCPVPFDELIDIKLRNPAPARMDGHRVIYHHRAEPGCKYVYKVVVYHKSGALSDDSNVVMLTTKRRQTEGSN